MVEKNISPFNLYILIYFSSIKLNCSLSSSIEPACSKAKSCSVIGSAVNDPDVSFLGTCDRISFQKKKMLAYVIMRNNKQV